jgi:hypothetical protein
VSSVD